MDIVPCVFKQIVEQVTFDEKKNALDLLTRIIDTEMIDFDATRTQIGGKIWIMRILFIQGILLEVTVTDL